MKKDYLVDVPVSVTIWIRPMLLERLMDVLMQARPSVLIITSDGPRNEAEKKLIQQSRDIIERIDWNCEIHKLYFDENQGMYRTHSFKEKYIFQRFDRCIFLEDDDIPSVSFFRYCADLLEKYKDDTRILEVCGYNFMGVYEDASSDYFFMKERPVWGTARWRRTHLLYNNDNEYYTDKYVFKCMSRLHNKNYMKLTEETGRTGLYKGHDPGDEYYARINSILQNGMYIIPKYNLINNMGFGEDGSHSSDYRIATRSERSYYNLPTYEFSFPLKHPKYCIPDIYFEHKFRKRFSLGYPMIVHYRHCIKAIKTLLIKGPAGLIQKMKKYALTKHEK